MINKVILLGRVGKNPETSKVRDSQVVKFSLATSERYKDKQGNKKELTEWHFCEVWGKLSEVVQKYVKKGDLLYVEGSIKTDTWEKDGDKKSMTKIRVLSVNLMPKANVGEIEKTSDDLPF